MNKSNLIEDLVRTIKRTDTSIKPIDTSDMSILVQNLFNYMSSANMELRKLRTTADSCFNDSYISSLIAEIIQETEKEIINISLLRIALKEM